MQKTVLNEIHASHMGVSRCKLIARSYVWWPNIDEHIENLCRACNTCNSVRQAPPKCSLNVWKFNPEPWTRLHLDFLGPVNGHKYLIVVDSTKSG